MLRTALAIAALLLIHQKTFAISGSTIIHGAVSITTPASRSDECDALERLATRYADEGNDSQLAQRIETLHNLGDQDLEFSNLSWMVTSKCFQQE